MSDEVKLPRISVVVPCFRSAEWLSELVERVDKSLNGEKLSFEIVLINDASGDGTWDRIEQLGKQYASVRGFDLLFNTGQHRATICGMEKSRGEIVVTMDDDLQQPPEAIPALLEPLSKSDCDCSMAAFKSKRHGPLRNVGTAVMARLFQVLYNKPRDLRASTFRAMRRQLVDAVCAHATINPNVNPLIFQTTRRIVNVTVDHNSRAGGRSGYSFFRLARLMLDNVLSVSTLPLKCVSMLGLFSAVGSAGLGLFYLVRFLMGRINEPGFTTVVLLITFFGGMTLFSIGLLGEYIIRIMDEVRQRPRYVIRHEVEPSKTVE